MNTCIQSVLLAVAISATTLPGAGRAAEPEAAASEKQAQPIRRTVLRRVDVPDSNYEVVLVLVEVPADTNVGRHTHPGTVVGYVIEGEYTMLIDGKAPQVLRTGESLEVPTGVVHDERTGNKPARLLAAFTVEKGKPLARSALPTSL